MPTLSTEVLPPAAAEVGLECLLGRHQLPPAEPVLQLAIAVVGAAPVGVPDAAVEYRRQLAVRPRRILLPQAAQRVTHGVRQIHGPEAPDLAFVEPQEPPARGKI